MRGINHQRTFTAEAPRTPGKAKSKKRKEKREKRKGKIEKRKSEKQIPATAGRPRRRSHKTGPASG
jgi:hypothetical protein